MLKHNRLVKNAISSILNSYSMIFFSKNQVFGVLLLIVSFFDIYAGLAGIISVITANLAARLLGLNFNNINNGFYGFNALLVGMGLGIALEPSVPFFAILLFISLATLFVTLIFEGVLGKYGLPYLTIPFLLVIWLSQLAIRNYAGLTPSEGDIYALNTMYGRGGQLMVDIYLWFGDVQWPLVVKTYFKSLGAIFFQYHLLAGILIAAGLLIYSRIAFLLSILGFAAAWTFYLIIGANIHDLDYGFIGFNHILTAIAIGGFFMVASRWSLLWVLILTPVVSIFITGSAELMKPYQLVIYSLPFNVVVLMFLYAMKFRERMLLKPETVIVQHFTPEKNLYAGMNARERFRNQQYFQFSLPFYGTWYISQGHNGQHTHRDDWKHAWDFVITDENQLEFNGEGTQLSDYYCFNKPILAPADGWIEETIDMIDDNEPGAFNLDQNWGNLIIIKHKDGLYSKLCHLKKDSIQVTRGSYVYKGQVIASCGNSGRSPYPHLHFQFQTTPYVGAKTLKYPFAQYVVNNVHHLLRLSGIPEENQLVQNIEVETSLSKAFEFVPGQQVVYTISGDEHSTGEWTVQTDMFNNTYLQCNASGSKAYFKKEAKLFYFTHFEGNRNTVLYHLYLAAYKLPLGFYKGMQVHDIYPPTILKTGLLRLVQDILAPFVLFLKPSFLLTYKNREEDLAGNNLTIESGCHLQLAGQQLRNWKYVIHISENKLQSLEIQTNKMKATAAFK